MEEAAKLSPRRTRERQDVKPEPVPAKPVAKVPAKKVETKKPKAIVH
jgi:hypothetical protein